MPKGNWCSGFTDRLRSTSVWAQCFGIDVICVTLGPNGCCIYSDGKAERFSGYLIEESDTVEVGDAFAAAFLHGYHLDWPMAKCAGIANALGALVAGRPGATPLWQIEECYALYDSFQDIRSACGR